jgi:TonB family protein
MVEWGYRVMRAIGLLVLLAACTSYHLKPMPPIPAELQQALANCAEPLGDPKQTYPSLLDQFPDRAARTGTQGWAVLEFTVAPDGVVSGISIVAEEPQGYGFGDTAEKYLSEQRFPARPKACTYRLPMTFSIYGH